MSGQLKGPQQIVFVFAEEDDRSLTDNMEGSYTYTSSEGYDEFLGKRGVPWIVRKMILAAPVELQVSLH